MILVNADATVVAVTPCALELIERAGRTCYKSEGKITRDSAAVFVRRLIKSGHHSVLEHASMTVRFTCDRGVSHELVRHRLASFSQESTRYCNYASGVTFVVPSWLDVRAGAYNLSDLLSFNGGPDGAAGLWLRHMFHSELSYQSLLQSGWTPQQARSVLPNSLKTEVVMTANMREWRHVFTLRTSKAAHPDMRHVMSIALGAAKQAVPVIFDDINPEEAE